jgi:PHAX RNA-binding domain-containing protein
MPERLTVSQLAAVLHETPSVLLSRIMLVLGPERCLTLLTEALLIAHSGVMVTADGRRRTVGGIFFQLCRERTTAAEHAVIFRRGGRRAQAS